MLFSGRTLARGIFKSFVIISLIVGLFFGTNYARGQALQAKWEAAAKQTAGHDPVQWWMSRSLNADKTHRSIFPGVDLTYIYDEKALHANLALAPQTKLDSVQFQFDDLQSLSIDANGEILIETAFGNFRLTAPQFSQKLNGQDIPLSGGFQQSEKGTLGFWSGFYDANRELQIRFSMELVQQKAAIVTPNATQAVNITASKVDTLAVDGNGNTKADPGDTLQYTVTVSNTGDTDATGVQFNDTIDANTTLVAGSVDTTPLAIADSFSAVGNVRIQVPSGSGLLNNDTEPDGTGGLTITAETKLSSSNGNVTINANGSFSYNPAPGFEGSDTFTYTLNDGEGNSDTGTVTITVSGMIWFINSASVLPQDGRLTNPFTSIANFNTTAADDSGDNIFVFSGTYAGPITLLNNQRFIGAGASNTLSSITGLTQPTFSDAFPSTGLTAPTMNTNGVILGSGNIVRGFVITGTGANAKITGNGFGTLILGNSTTPDVTLSGTGMALNLTTGTFAGTSGLVSVASTSSGTQGVLLSAVGGTVAFGSTTISGSTTQGILVTGSTVSVNFGNTSVTGGTDAISLQNNSSGTRTFGTLSTTNNSGVGFLHAVGGGTTTVTGATTITNPGGRGIDIQNSTTAITFADTDSISSGTTGVFLNANSGSISFADLDVLPDANQRGLQATENSGTITTTSGTISSGTATAVEITRTTGTTPLNIFLSETSSSGGSANGIILSNTSGSFTVNGDANTTVGGNGSGGTIANKTGADNSTTNGSGIFLNNASNVTLRRMIVNGTNQNFGIRGINVTNFTLEYSTINGSNGDSQGLDEGSINFDNLLGTASINSSIIAGGFEDNLNVVNTSGSLNRLTITSSDFGFNNTANGNNNILLEAQNAGTTLNFTIQSSTIRGARADWLNAACNSSSSMDAIVGGNTPALGNSFTNLGVSAHPGAAAGGNRIVLGSIGTLTYSISNNTLLGAKGSAIFVRSTGTFSGLTGVATGTISDNDVGAAGTANSGSSESSGISVMGDGGSDHTSVINNNDVVQYNNHGILLIFGDELNPGSVFNITVSNNRVNTPGNLLTDFNGFHLNNGTVGATDDFTSCVNIFNNNFTNSGSGVTPPNNNDVRLRHRQSTTIQLPGYAGPARDNGDNIVDEVITYLKSGLKNNTFNTGTANSVSTGGGYVNSPGGAPCVTPSLTLNESVPSDDSSAEELFNASFNTNDRKLEQDFSKSVIQDNTQLPQSVKPASYKTKKNQIPEVIPVAAKETSKAPELAPNSPSSGETINLNIGVLPFGKTITVRFRATVDSPFPQGDAQVCNQSTISGGNFSNVLSDDPDVGGATDPTCTTLAQANLSVTKADSPDPVPVGSNITYTVNFNNAGPDGATNVSVTDDVPADTTFVSATAPAGWTTTTPSVGGTGTITFTKAAVANAEAAIFTIVVQTDSGLADGTIISNTVDAVSDTPDGDITNNTDTETTTVQAPADLAVTKSDLLDPVIAGANITYTLDFVNNGPNASNNVSVADTVPAGTTFVSAQVISGTGWSTSAPPVGGTGTVSFTKGTVAASETATFQIVVLVNAATPDGSIITNTAAATASTLDNDLTNNTDTETTAVLARADLGVTKTDSPDPVIAGQNVTYTIDFVNNGPSIATSVGISDNMPPVTRFVSATAPAGWTSTTPPVGGFGPITFTKPTALPGETAQFTIVLNVQPAVTAPQIGNVVSVTSATQDDVTTNNTSIALTTVITQADLAITKSDSPDPVNAGENLTYTLDFVNNGPSDAQIVSITDTTPADTTFVSATAPAGWTSTTPPVGGTGTITFTRTTSAAGEVGQFTIVVNVNSDAADASTISNTADVTSATTDPNTANNSDTETTTVQTSADLSITKTDSPHPVGAGANITYTLDLTYNGPSDAQNVDVTDAVPANTTFVSATAPAGWTSTTPPVGGTGNVVFEKTTVAAGEAAQFTIVVAIAANVPSGLVITNTATATTDTTDPVLANNSATTTTTVNAISDLAVTKTDSDDPATAGQDLTYTITFVNNGPSDAQNVIVTDPLPVSTTFVSATAPAGWASTTPPVGGTGTVTFTKATVIAAETATFTIVVNIDPATPDNTILSNTVTTTSDSTDPDLTNNTATETTLVREPSDLSITKTDGLTDVTPGQSITYTIVAANNGRDDPAAVVTDDLPDELLNVTWSCIGSGGATCTLNGTGDINETVNLPDGGSVEFTVNATIDFAAVNQIVNTATITPGPGITDPDLSNNSASDTDTILCSFCDEFDDSTVDPNWTYNKSINPWSEDGNNLVGSASGNTTATAENVFAGCTTCTVFTSMQTSGGQFSRISLFAFFVDKKNTLELVMRQDKQRWVLKHKVAGTVVAKGNAKIPINANTVYSVRITFTGTEFQVFIDGAATPTITVPAVQQPSGSVGFRVKETTGTFDFIRVF